MRSQEEASSCAGSLNPLSSAMLVENLLPGIIQRPRGSVQLPTKIGGLPPMCMVGIDRTPQ
jgi:hypothetical protein